MTNKIAGRFNYIRGISIYEVFSITETLKLKLNVDAFSACNIQGRANPNPTDGTQPVTTSFITPRQVQIAMLL